MVVVALIGILTAAILPEMKGTYEDALLRSTTRELVDALTIAHSQSVSYNRQHRLRIDVNSGEYRVEQCRRSREGQEYLPVRDVPGCTGKLDQRVSVTVRSPLDRTPDAPFPNLDALDFPEDAGGDAVDVVNFFPDGTADARELVLQDRQGFRLVLRVNPTTSRIRINEAQRE